MPPHHAPSGGCPDALDQLEVDPQLATTLSEQLAQQLTWLIASGWLAPGDLLPPVRRAAERLGISVNTVRKAYAILEAAGLVRTRQGQGTIAAPHDPARMAAIAAGRRSHMVGVILPSLSNPFYLALMEGIESVAAPQRTMLMVGSTGDDDAVAWRCFAQMSARHVDGIIAVSHDVAPFAPEGSPALPVVAVDWPGSRGYSVELELGEAGRLATAHLAAHGHRRIGLVAPPGTLANVAPLVDGYRRALADAGIAADPALEAVAAGFGQEAGGHAARRLLALARPPTAVFAAADTLALGVMAAARQAGLTVPEELALAGFNDIPAAALVEPPLTTVAAPAQELGAKAMRTLAGLIGGAIPDSQRIVLPVSIVVRRSCGCPAV
jgi:DNA-binding LacI/PurR family transcriptional regulator